MKSTYLEKHYSAAIKGKQLKSLNIVKKKTIINYNGILSMLKWWVSGLITGGAVVVVIMW
jgi:hypothetical protein